jgi:hypothetical protein
LATSRVRPHRSSLAWTCVAVALCVPRLALALETGSNYRLQVVRADGAGSCPSTSVLERDVSQRLGRNPFSDVGERGIEVVLSRSDSKWQAKLYLRIDASDADAARLIESEAPDCAELGKSVALAVALAIAPELGPEVRSEPAPEPQPVCPPPPPPPVIAPRPTLHGELSVRALFSPNLLPKRSFGTGLTVTLRGELVGASLGGIFYPESELQTADAHLGFGVSTAFASGCLWARVRDPQVWSCIGARGGALHSVVYAPRPERPGDHWWWAASSELGLRQHFWGRAFLELGAAAVFPLARYRFDVDTSAASGASAPARARTVYEQGAASVEGFLGLGLRLD